MADFRQLVILTVTFFVLLVASVSADRIREKIYYDFTTHAFCMRRLNGTHEIGCSSSASGDVGVLHYVRTPEDLEHVTRKGLHSPYIAIINTLDLKFYNVKTLRGLQNSQRVTGVILIKYQNEIMKESFSPDKTCPNQAYGLYDEGDGGDSCGGIPWNSAGNGMLFERWNFPIFMLYENADIDYLLTNCTFRFNQPPVNDTVPLWPRCSAQLKSFMLAAADSQTCIRRTELVTNLSPQHRCDPLADFNVWSSLKPVNKSTPLAPKSTIIIAARLDASGMFESVPGVESSVSGLVTLMLVAETLAQVREDLAGRNIMFVVFNGEAFDYIGSSRVVYDMQNDQFPQKLVDSVSTQNALVGLGDIDFFIELSQLGLVRDAKFYLHSDPISGQDPYVSKQVGSFASIAAEEARRSSMDAVFLNTTQLPPASFQRFLKSGYKIPGVVLADHRREYQNQFYNGLFDDLEGQNSSYPANMSDSEAYNYELPLAVSARKVATVVARSIYKFVTGNTLDLEANQNTSANLMYCYAYKSNCSMFISYFNGTADQYLKNSSIDLYIGVRRSDSSPQLPSYLTSKTLANMMGERVNLTEDECPSRSQSASVDQMINLMFFYTSNVNGTRTGYCVRTNTNMSPAKSPAFLLNDFSGNYSTWTESVWSSTSIRIFLQPDPQEDINTMAFGVVATVLITVVIFGMSRAASQIFSPSEEEV